MVLGVGLGSLVIAGLNILLGCKFYSIARRRGFKEVLPFLFIVILLVLIGAALVSDEAAHMSRSDTAGMLAVICASAAFAFVSSFLGGRKYRGNQT